MTCKVEIKFPIIKKSNFSRFNPNLTLNAQVQVLEYKRNIFEISRERFDPGMIIGNSKISIKKCQFREIVKRQPEQCNCTETTRTVELYRDNQSSGIVQRQPEQWNFTETTRTVELYRDNQNSGIVQRQPEQWNFTETTRTVELS